MVWKPQKKIAGYRNKPRNARDHHHRLRRTNHDDVLIIHLYIHIDLQIQIIFSAGVQVLV